MSNVMTNLDLRSNDWYGKDYGLLNENEKDVVSRSIMADALASKTEFTADTRTLNDTTPEEWDAVHRGYYTKPVKITPVNNVDHPEHYNMGNIEAIEYIKQQTGAGFIDYCLGNAHKYLHRWRYKNGKEDLQKAVWYINKMIEELNG